MLVVVQNHQAAWPPGVARESGTRPALENVGPQTIMGFIKQLSLTGEARIVGVCLTMWHTVKKPILIGKIMMNQENWQCTLFSDKPIDGLCSTANC